MNIVQNLNRYKFECAGIVPVGPMQLLDFDNISIILRWSCVWGTFPEAGGQKSPEGVYSQKVAGGDGERREQLEKNPAGNRSGCAKSLWATRNIAAELSSALAGEASASCPNHKGRAGLPRTQGQMRVSVCGSSAGQKWSAPPLATLCVRGTPGPFGNCCAVEL